VSSNVEEGCGIGAVTMRRGDGRWAAAIRGFVLCRGSGERVRGAHGRRRDGSGWARYYRVIFSMGTVREPIYVACAGTSFKEGGYR
jgi:hypothetical protein